MKKILGLDLGVASIGWAMISEENDHKSILGMGSRIIPYDNDSKEDLNFTKGSGESKNQMRTKKRTQRKGYDRYQLRRKFLMDALKSKKMHPDENLMIVKKNDLWELRGRAVTEQVSLQELGRILLHLNQKRGYKSSRSEVNLNKKETDYVEEVKNRYEILKEKGLTIGQHFNNEILQDQYYRIKQQVFPREAYVEEFDRIMATQQQYHKEVLDDEFCYMLRNNIIYYQRKLKSQKGLVSVCEFEGFWKNANIAGKERSVFVGPKVAPKSSPLFQICKLWETINNLSLKNKRGEILVISQEQKVKIFEFLDRNEKLTFSELIKILELKKLDGWYGNKQISNGIQGNLTKVAIIKALAENKLLDSMLIFDLKVNSVEEEVYCVDQKTGEITGSSKRSVIDKDFEKQPFYQLWHTIYSITDIEECKNVLIKNFSLADSDAGKLALIDFTRQGFGNKSAKSIRKILPYLMEGNVFSDSCSFAGYNHSGSITTEDNLKRVLLSKLPLISKNSLRQPVVEKILNQMINVVNAIIEKFGKPDEIRVELARELKQSKEERNDTSSMINRISKENEAISKRLVAEYGLRATRNNIIKWRLFEEINGKESKSNAICIYCGQPFGITSVLQGREVDVEHIIPKARLFDDSQSNKTLSHRHCNEKKGNRTAYDFMKSMPQSDFESYLDRVEKLYKDKIIGKAKRDKLLMTSDKIPQDFLQRQLRETQYISKKAREILAGVCFNVWATSGNVTEYLRRVWGWNDVLMNLHLPSYRDLGLTEIIKVENDKQIYEKEVITGWTKRDDHRHHAIDALTVACTQQGFIQRINKLSSDISRTEMRSEIPNELYDDKKNLLENYIYSKKPFSTSNVMDEVSKILISYKAGKKVATFGVRKIKYKGKKKVIQSNILVPRGSLSEESVYGRIKLIEKGKSVKYLFENPETIVNGKIRELVCQRLSQFDQDKKSAISSLKKQPIFLDPENTKELEFGSCYKQEYVIKYPLGAGTGFLFSGKEDEKKTLTILESIIDHELMQKIRSRFYDETGNFISPKEALKDIENNPVWFNEMKRIPVKTVRCLTGLTAVVPVKKDISGKEIGFVKPGNNHHIAIYEDENGKKHEHSVTFWHAVERKKYGIPLIIKDTDAVWNNILNGPDNLPESFKENLPLHRWKFIISIQQNEIFSFYSSEDEITANLDVENKKAISNDLFRVQKLSKKDYCFRHHLETKTESNNSTQEAKKYLRFNSIDAFFKTSPVKIRCNVLGDIIHIGEI